MKIKTKKLKVFVSECILQQSFLPYIDLTCVPVHNHAKINNAGQYTAVLPSKVVSNPYILLNSQQLMQFYTKSDKCSKITNWVKLKNKQLHSKVLL